MVHRIFWFSFAFVFYIYLGYPGLLLVWRRIGSRPVKKRFYEPTVTIVIAAHNERERIEARLRNCLELDYPRDKLQIIVSLDGPTDGTEFAVWKYAAQGVEMIHSREHTGKAAALNRALGRATGEIVVFADARQTFGRRAIRELLSNFADDSVGAVSGELILLDPDQGKAGPGVGMYWKYEKAIRAMESDIHSTPGATGAIYAIRKDLYEDLADGTLLDDVVIPMRIAMRGRRVIFEPGAKAYDVVACCPLAEYRRKVRTLCGNYQLMAQMPQTLTPWRNPIFVQFVSHKAGRLAAPWALAALFVSNLFMMRSTLCQVTFALQALWYLLAAVGYRLSKNNAAASSLTANERKAA
jgi:biofilm PGA synthesis N-glycosyltransferase PgaC